MTNEELDELNRRIKLLGLNGKVIDTEDTYYIYKVGEADNLTEIANVFSEVTKTTITIYKIAEINNLHQIHYIVIGQTLRIPLSDATPAVPKNTNVASIATIDVFGLQSNTDRTMYAAWTFNRSYVDSYNTIWYYDTGDGIWFIGENSTTTDKQSTYSAPSNAKKVKLKVKPISAKRTVNGSETRYWTAQWSTEKIYDFSNNPPTTPAVPTVNIDKYKLTAKLENLDVNATKIQFQIVKNDSSIYKTASVSIATNSATYSCTVSAGNEYKVRARSYRDNMYSEWSNYSSNLGTIPSTPSGITELKATSETSIYLAWSSVKTAISYDIEYSTKKEYFDGSDQTTTISNVTYTHYEKTGLESGQEYFFRVRAVNSDGSSSWSGIKSIIIGENPAAPTTWSSSTTVITGDPLKLYWIHNSEDNSSQTYAELELYVNGVLTTLTIKNTEDEELKDKTSVYELDTSTYVEGTQIQWRVRTAGITKVYGDWSTQRTVDIYAPPTLELSVTNSNNENFDILETFPFYISALAGPNTQTPIGYYLTIVSNQTYETVDNIGNTKVISKGDSVYSKYFDITSELKVTLSASDVDLENNVEYTINCVVSMNSGLTTESTVNFTVAWTDKEYSPNAEISVDNETYTATIRPYCEDEFGNLIENITLSVYRREYDGSFVELATGLENSISVFITDPHPALDYARYRVVAIDNSTGSVSYYDIPGYPVGGKAVIIQWDEDWSSFDSINDDVMEQQPWAGSLLELPYNIDISDSYNPDVSCIEYIGRKHPVSYYGTQHGETSNWKVSIDKKDKETLYALRRLSIWMGNVYVREPSGSGYWASIKLSFSQTHCDTTIPVTMAVTRVSGGA